MNFSIEDVSALREALITSMVQNYCKKFEGVVLGNQGGSVGVRCQT